MAQVEIQVRQQYRLGVTDLSLFYREEGPNVFDLGSGRTVELSFPVDPERQAATTVDRFICTATAPVTVNGKRKELLDQIVQGRMPEGSRPDPGSHSPESAADHFAEFVDENGNLREGKLPDLRHLPNTLQNFVRDETDFLYGLAERTMRLLR